jgi:hypothetical protein
VTSKFKWKPFNPLPANMTRADIAALTKIKAEHGQQSAAQARRILKGFLAWAIGEGVADMNSVIGANSAQRLQEPRTRAHQQ